MTHPVTVGLADEEDWEGFRAAARALALRGVKPEAISWSVGAPEPVADPPAGGFGVPRALVALAQEVIRGRDPGRFDALYRLVWRIHGGERHLLDQADDPDVRRALAMRGGSGSGGGGGGGGGEPERPNSRLAEAAREAAECRRCDLWRQATQTVFGEGPADAALMLVGEQPGDQEDLAGRPFVGPAGLLLDRALAEAGIERREVYITNAVKHFKFEPRGKRRIHARPDAGEITACRFWLELERAEVRPALTVLMGASAARAVLGRAVTIGRERGRALELPGGAALVTVHPSYLLRLPDEAAQQREYDAFVADLKQARALSRGSR